jgi:hypothetical protein
MGDETAEGAAGGERPPWDEAVAKELVGRYLLIGITRLDAAGTQIQQVQIHGYVQSYDKMSGIKVHLEGKRKGETYMLPPDTQAFQRAKPGKYTLRSTGEIVVDPDFTTSWTIQEPAR